jgi:16S rRNA (cytidine1402-2'-O)-methyltransferase
MNSLILIPTPISEDKIYNVTREVQEVVRDTKCFVVERLRTARRFIKAIDKEINIDDLRFYEIGDLTDSKPLELFLKENIQAGNIGLMSEAGCPAIADPGNLAVQWCHKNRIQVKPLVGPSSIILGLMASGFNGQNFTFHGYLPNKKPDLIPKIKLMLLQIAKTKQTQIFIETPYRNRFMIETVLSCLNNSDLLCVCVDLDSPTMQVVNYSKSEWQNIDLDQFHKRPAIFLLG